MFFCSCPIGWATFCRFTTTPPLRVLRGCAANPVDGIPQRRHLPCLPRWASSQMSSWRLGISLQEKTQWGRWVAQFRCREHAAGDVLRAHTSTVIHQAARGRSSEVMNHTDLYPFNQTDKAVLNMNAWWMMSPLQPAQMCLYCQNEKVKFQQIIIKEKKWGKKSIMFLCIYAISFAHAYHIDLLTHRKHKLAQTVGDLL